ncbi:MAG: hypothetical protein ABIK98_13380, partial [Pseudomonadota bacterium]
IGNDILYTTAYGILKEAYVEKYFNLQQKVLDESGLTAKGYYYRILNWENFEKSAGKARKKKKTAPHTIYRRTDQRILPGIAASHGNHQLGSTRNFIRPYQRFPSIQGCF